MSGLKMQTEGDGKGMSAREERLRVAALCSFNLDLVERPLRRALSQRGLEAECYLSGYGRWEAEALDPDAGLCRFAPQLVFVFPELADLVPALTSDVTLAEEEAARRAGESAWQRVAVVLDALLGALSAGATVLCHDAVTPPVHPLGLLEGNAGYALGRVAETFNERLRRRCAAEPRLRLFDYSGLVSRHGWGAWHDRRLWHLGRMRLSRESVQLLAERYARCAAALFTQRRKCLVLDLDNTLWGGVIGEDGMAGIEVGHQGLGPAYREFQVAALALSQRGVILAACSKNNPEDALAVLRDHPDMVLRPEHLACWEINWEPKADNLRRLARRLNLGLDSLVFWDDNPVERETVRSQAPEVLVVDVPDDPSEYAAHLLDLECFDTLSFTEEDRRRARMYRDQAQRELHLEQAPPGNLAELYASLDMVATVRRADAFGIPRVAQLTQRTNQFNLTTRRYSESDVEAMAARPDCRVYTLQLRDRFGDLGIVGAAIVRCEGDRWFLDSFLVSCRALGRGAEEMFLAYLTARAEAAGARLAGSFVPTRKNAPARAFLERHGLSAPEGGADVPWEFTVPNLASRRPEWIELVVVEEMDG